MERAILLLGGDRRSEGIAAGLRARVHCPVFHRYSRECGAATLEELRTARGIVLPIPVSADGERLYAPGFAGEAPYLRPLFGEFSTAVPVFGGRITQPVSVAAAERGIRLRDLLSAEEVLLKNASVTAEGAVFLLMQNLQKTLWGARIAVLGYGRIGSQLARKLAALGASVSVAARRNTTLTQIACDGYTPISIEDAGNSLAVLREGYDAVCNTVPARILSPAITASLSSQTVLLELASQPGGWDPNGEIHCQTVYAPGLPATYAPVAAGDILAAYVAGFFTETEDKI